MATRDEDGTGRTAAKRTARRPRKRASAPPVGLRFVVTGCGRSGTKYASHLLIRAGVACGHEDVINRWAPTHGLHEGWQDAARASGLVGDSSFIAAPHAAELAAAGVTVVHQVRPPLDVIRSIVGVGWLRDVRLPYVAYLAHHVPEIAEQPAGPRRAAAAWLGWNALVEQHAHVTWRLHDLSSVDVTLLAKRAGLTVTATRAQEAIDHTPRTVNHRTRGAVTLDGLGPLADRVQAAAGDYDVPLEGYA